MAVPAWTVGRDVAAEKKKETKKKEKEKKRTFTDNHLALAVSYLHVLLG